MLTTMKSAQGSEADQGNLATFQVPKSTVRRYAAGSVGTGGFGTLPGLVLVYYLTDSLGVTALLAGLVVGVAKLWDVVIDPVIGELSDASLRRTGSRRRFMLIGAIALPIMFILTFSVPAGLHGLPAALWVMVCFVGAATAFSFFQVPYISLPAELTNKYDERTRLLTWRVVVLTIAILAFGGGGPALRELAGDDVRLGYLIMAVVAALAFGIAFAVSASIAPQRTTTHTTLNTDNGNGAVTPLSEQQANEPQSARAPLFSVLLRAARETKELLAHNAAFRTLLFAFFAQALATGLMLASAQYVATWILHDQAAVTYLFVALIAPALVMSPVWGKIADRHGKERAFFVASTIFLAGTLALVGLIWFPGNWLYIPVAVCGAAYAGMQSLPMAMMPDVVAYSLNQEASTRGTAEPRNAATDKLEFYQQTGTDSSQSTAQGAGIFGGVWTAGETTGLALGSTLMTIMLAVNGYVESTGAEIITQPGAALTAIVLSFSVVPAVCILASLPAIKKYPLTKKDVE